MKLITFILILTIITPMFVGAGIGMCLIIFALTTKWKGNTNELNKSSWKSVVKMESNLLSVYDNLSYSSFIF